MAKPQTIPPQDLRRDAEFLVDHGENMTVKELSRRLNRVVVQMQSFVLKKTGKEWRVSDPRVMCLADMARMSPSESRYSMINEANRALVALHDLTNPEVAP